MTTFQSNQLGKRRALLKKFMVDLKQLLILKAAAANFAIMRERHVEKTRRLLSSMLLVGYLKKVLGKRGDQRIRYHIQIQLNITFQAAALAKPFEDKAREILKAFLHAKMKREQLDLKMKNYDSRIRGIQKRSRDTLARMEAFEDSLVDQMDGAIVALKALTLQGSKWYKPLKAQKKGVFVKQLNGSDIERVLPEQRQEMRN